MSNINVVILTGNITRDPEVNYAGQTADRASFGLASTRKWRDQAGQQKEKTCFVDCTAWKKTAGVVAQYCKKGIKVAIEGSLELDQWNAQDGSKRSKLRVNVNKVELLGGDPSTAPGHHGHYEQPQSQQQMIGPDDVPF